MDKLSETEKMANIGDIIKKGNAEERKNTARIAHYIIARTKSNELGKTKLNKVLWFADLMHYRRYGVSMTGATSYTKRQYGPVPNQILAALGDLEENNIIAERMVETPTHPRKEFVWLERPDMINYSSAEVDILHEAIDWICGNHSAKSISDLTHDALWEEIELGKEIPIGAASVIPGEITEDDMSWAIQELEKCG